MGFCPNLTRLTANFLEKRLKTFQIGDYQSEPRQLTIGLLQGSPLLVILYILYNSPLLRVAESESNTISLAFINNVSFATAGASVKEVTQTLQHLADRGLEWGSKYGAAFDRAKSQWMLLTHKPPPPILPTILLGDVELTPQPHIKWLGVLLDPKLRFSSHVNAQLANGVKVANRLANIARTGWGVPLKQCLQLTSALIHSRIDYASVVWHRYGKATGPPSKLQRVDNIAHRFAVGAFKTHPTPFLRHNTCSPPTCARLDDKSDTAVLRLLCLPKSNPAARFTRAIFSKNQRARRWTVHHVLADANSVCGLIKTLPEVIYA